jgi:hypothetical protein
MAPHWDRRLMGHPTTSRDAPDMLAKWQFNSA